jgi:hypothetical protein
MKLPKTVFLSVQGEGEDQYLQAHDTLVAHADDSGKAVRVGKYELVEYADVALKPVIMPVAKPRRLR